MTDTPLVPIGLSDLRALVDAVAAVNDTTTALGECVERGMSEPIGALGHLPSAVEDVAAAAERLSRVVESMIRDALALTQDEALLSLLVAEPRGRA
jgi:hypothetical protein